MGAVFSACRTWRYSLTRDLQGCGERGCVVFIGLNPSTADETADDPTTRRCSRFARDWGFTQLELVNLYAYAATRPAALRRAPDPVGPRNREALGAAIAGADLVVCAWGNAGVGQEADAVLELLDRPCCLGLTAGGAPRHPLYVAAVTRPQRWFRPRAAEGMGTHIFPTPTEHVRRESAAAAAC
jgi:hypothetical protein